MPSREELIKAANEARDLGEHDLELQLLEKAYSLKPESVKPEKDTMMEHALGMSVGAGSLNKALSSFIPSTANVIGSTADALMHPISSVQGVADLAGGLLRESLPGLVQAPDKRGQSDKFKQVVEGLKNRYGSFDALKNTFENDPAGLLSDLSLVASPVNPRLSNAINPINYTAQAIKTGAPMLGSALAELVGGIATKTGGETLREAARSGMAGVGSSKSADFLDNLWNNVPATDVVDDALKGQSALHDNSFQDYLANTAGPFADRTPLNFENVKKALEQSNAMDVYNGIDINPGTASVKQRVGDIVSQFEARPDLRSIVDMDALKRGLGNIWRDTQPSTTENRAASNVYNAVKNEIVNQSADYGKAMKASEDSLDILKEISRELSLNPKANIGTQLRKLQSVTRNNAYTSYGHRVSLAKMLEDAGAENLMAKLSGQALNTWQPRGLGSLQQGGLMGAGYLTKMLPEAVGIAALHSPKLMGLASYGLGVGANLTGKAAKELNKIADKLGVNPSLIANVLYHTQSQ